MLMSRPRTQSTANEMANVHNFYEKQVTESILKTNPRAMEDSDFLADVSCVALNHLPPRYIRHDVDMNFFMSPTEREEIERKVQNVVDHAIEFVLNHEKSKRDNTDTE
jgi:competence protein ComFB